MTKAERVWGALGCMAIFAVFAALCWIQGSPGISLLMLLIGGGLVLFFAFASENIIKLIGSLW